MVVSVMQPLRALAAHAPARASAAAAKKEADEEARQEELDRRRKTTAPVPAMEVDDSDK
jgi:hypothetical protein